jgi:hypothetical protein
MNQTQPNDEFRVIRLRPRETRPVKPVARASGAAPARRSPGTDDEEERADYRSRMIANAAAVVVTLLLLGAGIWLASHLAHMRDLQDCVLSGRRDCAQLVNPRS